MTKQNSILAVVFSALFLIGCDKSLNLDMNIPNILGPVKVVSCKGSFVRFGDEKGDEFETNLIIVPYNSPSRFQFLLLPMYFYYDSAGNVTGENINRFVIYEHNMKRNNKGLIESRNLDGGFFHKWQGLIWRYKYQYDDNDRLTQEIKYDSIGNEETMTTYRYEGNEVIIRIVDPKDKLLTYQVMTFNEKKDLIKLLDSMQTHYFFITTTNYFEYKSYDSIGNWTERLVLDEDRKPKAIHVREITYYGNKKLKEEEL